MSPPIPILVLRNRERSLTMMIIIPLRLLMTISRLPIHSVAGLILIITLPMPVLLSRVRGDDAIRRRQDVVCYLSVVLPVLFIVVRVDLHLHLHLHLHLPLLVHAVLRVIRPLQVLANPPADLLVALLALVPLVLHVALRASLLVMRAPRLSLRVSPLAMTAPRVVALVVLAVTRPLRMILLVSLHTSSTRVCS